MNRPASGDPSGGGPVREPDDGPAGGPAGGGPDGGSVHRVVPVPGLPEPVGYAHAVVAAPGRLVQLGGQTAQGPDGRIRGATMAEQFDVAAANVTAVLAAAGARPEHLVSLVIYVTDMAAYRASLRELGEVYRRHFGRHYPAIALLGVAELFDPQARVELLGTAVIPRGNWAL